MKNISSRDLIYIENVHFKNISVPVILTWCTELMTALWDSI